jgi:diaminopimelate decarboxylase
VQVVRRYGTPAYAYDITRLRQQVVLLQSALPPGVEVLYSLKANPSLGLCSLIASWGLGADVASVGELLIALEAGFPPERILVGGPYKSPETLACLRSHPEILLSVDSLGELQALARQEQPFRVLLRLRPDFPSPAVVHMGPDSRFGIPYTELARCRSSIAPSSAITVVGFHVFSGSQILDDAAMIHHLRGAVELSLCAADVLGLAPEVLNIGGGFGVPYGPNDRALNLEPIAQELSCLLKQAAPARFMLELGRYVVAQAGWYLTTVATCQGDGERQRAVVDGGVHQRADLCGLGLRTRAFPPLVFSVRDLAACGAVSPEGSTVSGGPESDKQGPVSLVTNVWGCLCLPDDVLVEACALPRLKAGDILAFPNAGAYGFSASPMLFLSHPAPVEVAFEGMLAEVLRNRQSARAIVEGQGRLHRVRMVTQQSEVQE